MHFQILLPSAFNSINNVRIDSRFSKIQQKLAQVKIIRLIKKRLKKVSLQSETTGEAVEAAEKSQSDTATTSTATTSTDTTSTQNTGTTPSAAASGSGSVVLSNGNTAGEVILCSGTDGSCYW